ncbi:uncharacterized protein LOC100905521 [Galendromus occidentalis]|uniref:Uncharacterized protein LOC100905521 n=1 Tax=Galendromus occidentalis TaxID=34638 RepID=A0AAJ6QQW6_9ACAR|nr:uncharacterized protein LOC100905521 [Galendromus occidentalis]
MKPAPIVLILACGFAAASDVPNACSEDLTQNLVNDPVFKQCDGMLVNYFIQHHGLTRDNIRYVTGKTTASSTGSQILSEDKKSGKCVVAVVESVPRSPPRISSLCTVPLPCPGSSAYTEC